MKEIIYVTDISCHILYESYVLIHISDPCIKQLGTYDFVQSVTIYIQ